MTNKLEVKPHQSGACVHGIKPPMICQQCGDYLTRLRKPVPGDTFIPPATVSAAPHRFEAAGYEAFSRILSDAFEQVARGKGATRHGRGRPWLEQPIMTIARMIGLGGHSYQIMKKAQEAQAMFERGEHNAAIAEFRGVIGYAAAAIAFIEEKKE